MNGENKHLKTTREVIMEEQKAITDEQKVEFKTQEFKILCHAYFPDCVFTTTKIHNYNTCTMRYKNIRVVRSYWHYFGSLYDECSVDIHIQSDYPPKIGTAYKHRYSIPLNNLIPIFKRIKKFKKIYGIYLR